MTIELHNHKVKLIGVEGEYTGIVKDDLDDKRLVSIECAPAAIFIRVPRVVALSRIERDGENAEIYYS